MTRYTTMTLEQLLAEEAALQCALEAVRGKASPWRPIEEAPRDGTRVLLYPYMMAAHWEFGDENWQFFSVPLNSDMTVAFDWQEPAAIFFCVSDKIYGAEPTHFMPLPTPPALGEV